MLTLRGLAQALGGHVEGSCVRVPGPGHSKRDDSLRIVLSSRAENGFVVHSHAGDDWQACRDYVVQRLGLSRDIKSRPRRFVPRLTGEQERYARARELWHAARTDDLREQLRKVYPNLFKDDAAWAEAMKHV
jgi:putative DNA primase/helicase